MKASRLTVFTTGFGWFAVSASAGAADYYVAPPPAGSDSANGSSSAPFATMSRAQQAASSGDTVYFAAGTYVFDGSAAEGIVLSKSGIKYFAAEGERPVFDFSGLTASARLKGISVTGNSIHLRGFEIHSVRQPRTDQKESWGIHINGGDDNIFENLDVHDIMGPGIFIEEGGNNLVLNCDSHDNYDENSYDGGPTPGENADGFGCHSGNPGNVFRGCRAWWNSDDGFDFINSPGTCVVEHSFAFRNGYVPGTTMAIGNGAGIKGGGFTNNVPATIPRHRVLFNVAFGNRRQGFYANHHEGGIDWINNVAFDNRERNFDMLADEGPAPHLLRNNVAFGDGGTVSNLTASEVDNDFNTWNLSIMAGSADFASTVEDDALAPRQPDGSLPNNGFLRPVAGSELVDAGEPQDGFEYVGSAPDLGAFEYGATEGGSGTGGAATGGSAGASGTDGGANASGAGGSAQAGTDAAGGAGANGNAGNPSAGTNSSGGAAQAGSGSAAGGTPGSSGSANPSGGSPAGGTPAASGSSGRPPGGGAGTPASGGTNPTSAAGGAANSPEDDAGCGCRVGARARSPFAVALLAALAVLGALRRRSLRRHAGSAML